MADTFKLPPDDDGSDDMTGFPTNHDTVDDAAVDDAAAEVEQLTEEIAEEVDEVAEEIAAEILENAGAEVAALAAEVGPETAAEIVAEVAEAVAEEVVAEALTEEIIEELIEEVVAEADASDLADAELLAVEVDEEATADAAAVRAEPLRPFGPLVCRAHVCRIREQGEVEPGEPRPFDDGRGPHLRGRHPDGGRHRVQERAQGRRPEEGLPRLPAGAHGPRRPRVVRRAQHARRHRIRWKRREADPALAPRGGGHPRHRREGRGPGGGEEGPPAPRVRGGRAGAGRHRPLRRLQRCDQRDRR